MKSALVYASVSYWFIFVLLLAGAVISGSSSMISETMHQLFDSVSVSFALLSSILTVKPSTDRLSYGYHRMENLSVIINAIALLGGAAFSLYIATERLFGSSRIEPRNALIISVAALPLLIITTMLLNRGKHDMAERSVFVHTISDSVTLIVLIFTLLVLHFYNSSVVDSVSAYVITGIFLFTSVPLLKDGIRVLMDVAPENIDEIERELKKKSEGVHHVHIWTMCSHIKIATIHVAERGDASLADLEKERDALEKVLAGYGINHTTIQFESIERSSTAKSD